MKSIIIRSFLIAALLAPVGLFLHFFLPRSEIVQVEGTDVKRLDNDSNRIGQTDASRSATRDVFLINTSVPGSDEVLVYRNEDTGWGFPFYFKFNDSDINATASKLANEKAIAKVRYYGFRIQLLSMWPNVISIERAEVGDSTFPWGRVIFFTVFALVFGYAYWKLRGLFARLFKKRDA